MDRSSGGGRDDDENTNSVDHHSFQQQQQSNVMWYFRGGILLKLLIAIVMISIMTMTLGQRWLLKHYHDDNDDTIRINSPSSFSLNHSDDDLLLHHYPPRVVVFYHIYIPPDHGRDGLLLAQSIIQEQILQIRQAAQELWEDSSSSPSHQRQKLGQQGRQSWMLRKRTATTSLPLTPITPWEVFFTTTGTNTTPDQLQLQQQHDVSPVTHDWILQHVCAPHQRYISCHPTMPHQFSGFEDLTLHSMYRYCQKEEEQQQQQSSELRQKQILTSRPPFTTTKINSNISSDNKADIVIYIHSKGTFHSAKGRNHHWRRALTQAATHVSCLHALMRHSSTSSSSPTQQPKQSQLQQQIKQQPMCNVCGLQFVPLWTTMFPGNMFSTTCSYVQQLLDPQGEFPQRIGTLVSRINGSSINTSTQLSYNHDNTYFIHERYNFDNPSIVGLGRYAAEQWVTSHPNVRPCDFQPGPSINNNTTNKTRISWVLERIDAAMSANINHRGFVKTKFFSYFLWWQTNNPSSLLDIYLTNIQPTVLTPPARGAPQYSLDQGNWYRMKPPSPLNSSLTATPARQGSSSLLFPLLPPYEYFDLPGLLYRHLHFYNSIPEADSWMWQWFPQGWQWKQKLYPTSYNNGYYKNRTAKKLLANDAAVATAIRLLGYDDT